MVRIGMVLLSLAIAAAVGAEPLPSILSAEGQAFLMGPMAMEGASVSVDDIPVIAPETRLEADEGPAVEPDAPVMASSSGGEVKSPRRAFLYSVLVPGLGEWYAGAKKRGLVFFGIEAVALGVWSSWKGKGNDAEKEFRAVADEQWDPLNYLAWRGSTISRNSSITHALPCSSYVDVYIETGKFKGCDDAEIQQYYELLGKYDQFVPGWTDLIRADTGNPAQPTEVDSVENFHSARRLTYEIDRDESNKFLKRASTLTGLILINHVFSAIDAARVTRARAEGADEVALQRRTRMAFVMQPWRRGHVPMLMAYKPFD